MIRDALGVLILAAFFAYMTVGYWFIVARPKLAETGDAPGILSDGTVVPAGMDA